MQQACARSVPVSACSASPPLNAPSALTTCQTTLRIVSTMSTINASEIAQQDTSLIQAPQKTCSAEAALRFATTAMMRILAPFAI